MSCQTAYSRKNSNCYANSFLSKNIIYWTASALALRFEVF